MGFLKNLFNKKQTIENNDNIQQQTKIYVDENMADEIVKVLNEINKQKE